MSFSSWLLVMDWFSIGSRPGYYSGGEGGSRSNGKVSAQIIPWRVVDFSSDIFLDNRQVSLLNLTWDNSETTRWTITCSQLIIFWAYDPGKTNSLFSLRLVMANRSSGPILILVKNNTYWVYVQILLFLVKLTSVNF